MFEKVKCKDTILASLVSDIAKHKKTKKQAYPDQLVARCLHYLDTTTIKNNKFADLTGIAIPTICRWKKEHGPAKPVPLEKVKVKEKVKPKTKTISEVTVKKNGAEILVAISDLKEVLEALK